MSTSLKLGFIGLGIMGAPMAGHLRAAGHQLAVNTHGPVPEALVSAGGVTCANGKEGGQQSDIGFIMVPDTPPTQRRRAAS